MVAFAHGGNMKASVLNRDLLKTSCTKFTKIHKESLMHFILQLNPLTSLKIWPLNMFLLTGRTSALF